eukprot:jgi/Chrzof1/6903/Cz02g02220.t1
MGTVEYMQAFFYNYVYGTFLQKVGMLRLPHVDKIGGDVSGLTAIVTGSTSGIGKATAAALARRGAHVVLACRSQSKGERLIEDLKADSKAAGLPAPNLEIGVLDLSSLDSVKRFVASWDKKQRPLHILINNAGVFQLGAHDRKVTDDGLELHMATNHLGPFLLTMGLLPSLQRTAKSCEFGARVVNVASHMHYFGFGLSPSDPLMEKGSKRFNSEAAYGRSKLAELLFTMELRRRLPPDSHVAVIAVHPGNVLTDVVRSLPGFIQKTYKVLLTRVLLTPEQGSRASMFAATDPEAPKLASDVSAYFDAGAKPVTPSKQALDESLARWLWDWSAKTVKLPAEWNLPPRQ